MKRWMQRCLTLAIGAWITSSTSAQQFGANPQVILPARNIAAAGRNGVPSREILPSEIGVVTPTPVVVPSSSQVSGNTVQRLPLVLGSAMSPAAQRITVVQGLPNAVPPHVQQMAVDQPAAGMAAPTAPVVRPATPGPAWVAPQPAVNSYPQAAAGGYSQPAAFNAPPSPGFRSEQEGQNANPGRFSGPIRPPLDRLKIPPGLPGANAPPLDLPPFKADNQLQYSETIDRLFPRLPAPPRATPARPGPGGQKMTYLELLEIARENSPLLRQYRADILAARGNAIDVGALPNPQIGFEMDTVGRLEPNQYVGGMVNQTVITAGKLRLQRSAALQDVRNRELDYRAADIDVATAVLAQYYAVLVAQEAMKATNALVQFTDETYRVLVEQTKGGETAAYEPLQLRVLATQARAAAVQAHNRYISSWQQLTAAMAVPQMPPTELEGRVDAPTPDVCWDLAVDRVTRFHTDVLIAQTTITREQFSLRRQQVDPIPNINTYAAIQKDNTQPSDVSMNLQTYIALPIFYRNQGGILQAQGQLSRAQQQVQQAQNELILRLATIFERYENARRILVLYRDHILPDQSRAYSGVFERHQQQPDKIAFGDVVVAQQILATTVNQYIAVLGDQWNALADLENVTQVLDLSILVENNNRVPPPPPTENIPPGQQRPQALPQPPAPPDQKAAPQGAAARQAPVQMVAAQGPPAQSAPQQLAPSYGLPPEGARFGSQILPVAGPQSGLQSATQPCAPLAPPNPLR
ncbi:MAG TPA: TolC family protein [Pirellulales bacterium]